MSRKIMIELECIELNDGTYAMGIEVKTDKPKGIPSVKGVFENGLHTRFYNSIQELINIARQGGLQ
jgi:hypothetical protein